MSDGEFITVKTIARDARRDPRTVLTWINPGVLMSNGRVTLAATRHGKSWKVRKDDWEKFKAAREGRSGEAASSIPATLVRAAGKAFAATEIGARAVRVRRNPRTGEGSCEYVCLPPRVAPGLRVPALHDYYAHHFPRLAGLAFEIALCASPRSRHGDPVYAAARAAAAKLLGSPAAARHLAECVWAEAEAFAGIESWRDCVLLLAKRLRVATNFNFPRNFNRPVNSGPAGG